MLIIMKILIINDRPHQFSLLKSVSDKLLPRGINIDIIIPNAGIFYSSRGEKVPLLFRPYRYLCKYLYPKVILLRFFYGLYVYIIAKQYSAVDFQGLFVSDYVHIIDRLKRKYEQRIKVTVWGSDFYRQAGGTYEEKELIYKSSDIIHIGTQQMADDFISRYPHYSGKIRIAHFGLEKLEKIKKMLSSNERKLPSFLIHKNNKIVVVCGYNGSPAQQHSLIIEALERIPTDLKKKLFVVLPMTYGTPQDYEDAIKKKIKDSGVDFHIIDHYLSEEELIQLRLRTDIAVNIQITDAFAGSIQEHIMASNLLVVGDWLPYHKIFEENNIFVRYTKKDDLAQNLIWAIENYQIVKDKLQSNSEAIYNFSSWENAAEKWVRIYNELLTV